MDSWVVKDKVLEYLDETHTYVYDGIVYPSITQIMKVRFGHKYDGVNRADLQKAAELGTAVHKAIEDYEKSGVESDLVELHNWKFLKKSYGFNCLANEIPVVLFDGEEPIACGRLDLVIEEGGQKGLADIKRTSTLDKEYLGVQLNLYRIAYQQCYGTEIELLRGVHLRENTRKYVPIPINEGYALDVVTEWKGEQE